MNEIKSSNIPELINGSFEYIAKTDSINLKKQGFFKNKIIMSYNATDVKKFKVLNPNVQKVGTKGTVGTVAGAAVGGILTGGVGAIVGGMAGGNQIETTSTTDCAFEMNDGNWVVIHFSNTNDEDFVGRCSNVIIDAYKKRFSSNLVNPFN